MQTIECPQCHVHFEHEEKPDAVDILVKLRTAEALLADYFDSTPSRPTIVSWIHDGVLRGRQVGRGDNWFIYQSSLDEFIRDLTTAPLLKLAA